MIGNQKAYYDNGILEYEGEFLDDKFHGKGKRYNELGRLIFEGEYKEGQEWNGINKIYNDNGKIEIEIIIQNRENKKSQEYNDKGDIISIREYLSEKMSEFGKDYFNGILIFEGEYKESKRNGKGKEYNYYTKKILFEGEYKNGKRNGKGIEYDSHSGKIIFEGEFISNIKWSGKGYNEKNEVEYEIKDGTGKVKEFFNDKLIYDGEYLKGKRNGYGKEYNIITGYLIYEGEYLNGKRNGKGKEFYKGKLKYEVEYLNGMRNKIIKINNHNI